MKTTVFISLETLMFFALKEASDKFSEIAEKVIECKKILQSKSERFLIARKILKELENKGIEL